MGGPGGGPAPARRELPEAGWWAPAIVTNKDGKATVTIDLPETTTRWRLTSRGCTVETLVGQAAANVITRQDFFVEIKAPASLLEGDKPQPIVRIHNLTDYEGPVDLVLTVTSGDKKLAQRTKRAEVAKHATAEVVLDAFETPATGELQIEVRATAGELTDALSRTVGVRPWGLEYADHTGGAAGGDAAAFVELPKGLTYSSTWMTVSVSPTIEQAVLDMALADAPIVRWVEAGGAAGRVAPVPPPGRFGGHPAS